MSLHDVDGRIERIQAELHRREQLIDFARRNTPPVEWTMTESQRRERAKQEIAMRNGQLRRIPTVFGDLA